MPADEIEPALESVLGDLPDNVTEKERDVHLHALHVYVELGDAKQMNAIPESALRLLRVKFAGWNGPRFKSIANRYLPPQQLLGAMDERLRKLESLASRREKVLMLLYGALLGGAVTQLFMWLRA